MSPPRTTGSLMRFVLSKIDPMHTQSWAPAPHSISGSPSSRTTFASGTLAIWMRRPCENTPRPLRRSCEARASGSRTRRPREMLRPRQVPVPQVGRCWASGYSRCLVRPRGSSSPNVALLEDDMFVLQYRQGAADHVLASRDGSEHITRHSGTQRQPECVSCQNKASGLSLNLSAGSRQRGGL